MKSPTVAGTLVLLLGTLLMPIFISAQPAAAQEARPSEQPQLSPSQRARLAEAARDSTIAPWQRELMLEVARQRVEGDANEPPHALPGLALPTAGVATVDGEWAAIPLFSTRSGHTAIYDPLRERMVVFGGSDGSSQRNDVYVLSLSGTPAWSALAPTGTPPSARNGHAAIYDPIRDRMVVFGGFYYDGTSHYLNDAFVLTLSGNPTWSPLAPSGTPPASRYGHTAIYDPVRDRMVVFGGSDGGNRNDWPCPDSVDSLPTLPESPAPSRKLPG